MQIPNHLQDVWKKITQDDGQISKDEFTELVRAAAPNGDADLDATEEQFLVKLKSDLEQNGIATKGAVPVGVLSFDAPPVQSQPQVKQEPVSQPETQQNYQAAQSPASPKEEYGNFAPPDNSVPFPLPDVNFPEVPVDNNWQGYTREGNAAFASAFNEPMPPGNMVPVLPPTKSQQITEAFGFGSIEQMQQNVGAKQDKRFGPETYFKTKAVMATNINATQDFDRLSQMRNILGVLGNDPQIHQMRSILDQRIQLAQQSGLMKQMVQDYVSNVNTLLSQADPASMESLVSTKGQLEQQFKSLPGILQNHPPVQEIQTEAMGRINAAIEALQAKDKQLGEMKNQLAGELNQLVRATVAEGLKTGDAELVRAAKPKVGETIEKFPEIKDLPDVKELGEKAIKVLDNAANLIDEINALINKPNWNDADMDKANQFLNQLPEGPFKDKLAAAIEKNSAAGKLKDKNRSNLNTVREGLHDVIGNGFWNLENSEGTRGMFQLIAKQGLLDEAITKMNVDDQTRAIKVLTEEINFKKGGPKTSADEFNVAIADYIYNSLSESADVDDEIKKHARKHLKNTESPTTFDNFNIDINDFSKGLSFSIGSDRIGSEKKAALTMARGIINGEVSRAVLGKLDKYEIKDLTKFVQKEGSSAEKNEFLNTVSQAYHEGVDVRIDKLDKRDKGKVIKGVLEIDNVNEGKLGKLVDHAGKGAVIETVRNERLNDRQLAILAKHTNGDKMADEPDVGAKLLTGMIKTYNKQEDNSPVKIGDIRSYIDEVDKDWWEDDDTMRIVLSQLGDGPGSEYQKFQDLAPATLDKIWKISD